MKLHRTLVQPFLLEDNRSLAEYLTTNGISYHISAEFAEDIGLKGSHGSGILINTYVALIEEHELSAIFLSVDNIHQIKNRRWYDIKNSFRNTFRWLFR